MTAFLLYNENDSDYFRFALHDMQSYRFPTGSGSLNVKSDHARFLASLLSAVCPKSLPTTSGNKLAWYML